VDTFLQATIQWNYFQAMGTLQNKNQQMSAGPAVTSATSMALAFRAFAVFEYDNKDGVPGFQESNAANADVVTGLYDLSNFGVQWNNFVFSSKIVNGVNVTVVSVSTVDNVFTMKLTFAGNPIQITNAAANAQTLITPNQVKIDFTIQWFNNPKNIKNNMFNTGASSPILHPNASVGLATITAAQNGVFNHLNGTKGAAFTFTQGAFTTAFTYASNVTVIYNGIQTTETVHVHVVDQPINPTYQSQMNWVSTWVQKIGFFSWTLPRPSLVFWDPVVGDYTPGTIDGSTAATAGKGNAAASSMQPIAFLLFVVLLLLS